jgi:uncharacterized protein
MYEASVDVFNQYLASLSANLDLAVAHADARRIDPAILLRSRLHPTM